MSWSIQLRQNAKKSQIEVGGLHLVSRSDRWKSCSRNNFIQFKFIPTRISLPNPSTCSMQALAIILASWTSWAMSRASFSKLAAGHQNWWPTHVPNCRRNQVQMTYVDKLWNYPVPGGDSFFWQLGTILLNFHTNHCFDNKTKKMAGTVT